MRIRVGPSTGLRLSNVKGKSCKCPRIEHIGIFVSSLLSDGQRRNIARNQHLESIGFVSHIRCPGGRVNRDCEVVGPELARQTNAAMSHGNILADVAVSNPRFSWSRGNDTCPVTRDGVRCRREICQDGFIRGGWAGCWHRDSNQGEGVRGIENSALAWVLDDNLEV